MYVDLFANIFNFSLIIREREREREREKYLLIQYSVLANNFYQLKQISEQFLIRQKRFFF